MNARGTQTHRHKLKLPKVVQKILLDSPQGAAIEDRNGVLIAIRLPKALEYVHVSCLATLRSLCLIVPLGPDSPYWEKIQS